MATVLRSPFRVPRPADEGFYVILPKRSAIIEPLLTSVKFFGAGGQAPTKRWSYDYDDFSNWQFVRRKNLNLVEVVSPPGIPKEWSFTVTEDQLWSPLLHKNLNLLEIPFIARIRDLEVSEDFFWLGRSRGIPRTLTITGTPVTPRFWAYNRDDSSVWDGKPKALNTLLQVFQIYKPGQFWITEPFDSEVYQQTILRNLVLNTAPPVIPVEYPHTWRFNLDDSSNWQRVYYKNLNLVEVVETPVRAIFWKFGEDVSSNWQGTPLKSAVIFLPLTTIFFGARGQVPTKYWGAWYNYDVDKVGWFPTIPVVPPVFSAPPPAPDLEIHCLPFFSTVGKLKSF